MIRTASKCCWLLYLLLVAGVSDLRAQKPPYDVFPPAEPPYYRVRYEASTKPGELVFPVNYTIWIPKDVKTLRGVIVHQHGCGEGSCKSGLTGAFDLHWQALAKQHDCALLSPAYEQPEKANCQLWCDPRNGSDAAFQKCLADFGTKSGHPELAKVPWALWGHSGGGHWAGGMVLLHPDRVVAAWLRSGVPLLKADPTRTDIKAHSLPDAALKVPVMCNLGTKEGVTVRDNGFKGVWPANEVFFKEVRGKGGLVGVAIDPLSSHDCGNQRYLAIPWLDACLTARVPKAAGDPLQAMPADKAWLAPILGGEATPIAKYPGEPLKAAWLPNEEMAKAWMEYVKDTKVTDATPPPGPTNVRIQGNKLTWEAEADLESGLASFVIERDGLFLANVPEEGKNSFGRPIFQNLQYSDTPTQPLVPMQFTDTKAEAGKKHAYRVIAVNTVGLKSKPSAESAALPEPPKPDVDAIAGKRVVFLGDSITQAGEYVAFTTYYLEKLYPKKDFDLLGLGLASETLSGLSEDGHAGGKFPRPCLFDRLDGLLEKARPEVVFACYGMNDGIYLPLDKDRFAAFQKGVTKLIEHCKKAGVKQIFLVTPPIYDLVPKKDEFNYDTVLAEYAKWEMSLMVPGVFAIDLHTAMRKARDSRAEAFSQDKVHPGDDGHLVIAKTILTALGVKVPDETVAAIKAEPLFKLLEQKRGMRSAAWMRHIGYTREKTVKPEPLGTTEEDAAKFQEKIDALRRQK
jgi:lysophospholipase L1-like esterase